MLGAGDTGGSAFNPIVAGPGCGTGTWTKDGAHGQPLELFVPSAITVAGQHGDRFRV